MEESGEWLCVCGWMCLCQCINLLVLHHFCQIPQAHRFLLSLEVSVLHASEHVTLSPVPDRRKPLLKAWKWWVNGCVSGCVCVSVSICLSCIIFVKSLRLAGNAVSPSRRCEYYTPVSITLSPVPDQRWPPLKGTTALRNMVCVCVGVCSCLCVGVSVVGCGCRGMWGWGCHRRGLELEENGMVVWADCYELNSRYSSKGGLEPTRHIHPNQDAILTYAALNLWENSLTSHIVELWKAACR